MMRITTREVAVVEIMLTPAPLTSQHRCIVIPIHLRVVKGRPDSQFIVVLFYTFVGLSITPRRINPQMVVQTNFKIVVKTIIVKIKVKTKMANI